MRYVLLVVATSLLLLAGMALADEGFVGGDNHIDVEMSGGQW